jgi:hypothetical protein
MECANVFGDGTPIDTGGERGRGTLYSGGVDVLEGGLAVRGGWDFDEEAESRLNQLQQNS